MGKGAVIFLVVLFGIVGYLGFVAYQYNSSAEGSGCIKIVNGQVNMHCGFPVSFAFCGTETILPQNSGPDGGFHTHASQKEWSFHPIMFLAEDYNHTALLHKAFSDMNYEFGEGVVEDPSTGKVYKDGDVCPNGQHGKLKVLVNDRELSPAEYQTYALQEGDKTEVIFD